MLFFPNSRVIVNFYSLGNPFAPSKATRRLKRSFTISATSTRIFCHVAGYAFGLSSFIKG